MSQDNGNQDSLMNVSRRRYAQAILGGSAAGLAGCSTGGDGGDGDGGGDGGDGGATPTASPTAGDGEAATATATQREPVSSRISASIINVPEQSNLNEWGATVNGEGTRWVTEIVRPFFIPEARYFLNGHTYETPHHPELDEIQLHAVVDDFAVTPPYDTTTYIRGHDEGGRRNPGQDPLTYWDGETPIDADAYETYDAIYYYNDGNKFDESTTFNTEATGQFVLERWNDKGEVPDQDPDPTNAEVLRANHVLSTQELPIHPAFTGPYREMYRDASSQDAVSSVSEELAGDNITFNRWAEEGWGSGLYRVDAEDISAERMIGTMREDHPGSAHATIPEVEMQFAAADRIPVLAEQGELDIWGGIVQTGGGRYNRSMLPDHIQEVDRWLQNGADALFFNWNNDHLSNLWVRRALVTVIDWEAVGANGWGAERSFPAEHHTGLYDNQSEGTFPSEFLDALHTYSIEADADLAAEYMRRAGYTREGSVWTDAEGNELALRFVSNSAIADWTGAAQTIQSNLQNFGVRINYSGLNWSSYISALEPDNLNYDIMLKWHGFARPWQYYWTQSAWWGDWLLGGDPTGESVSARSTIDRDSDAEVDTKGKPVVVDVPDEPGAVEAPDEAGAAPSLPNATETDLVDVVHALRDPGVDEATYQELVETCARYYNFYLPHFAFHNYTWGLSGNVRDFEFAPQGHDANRTQKEFSTDHFNVLAGVVQVSYDGDYEAP